MDIKQDINFLEKPLWFQNPRHDEDQFAWKDGDGYIYKSNEKPPDHLDMLILLYLLLASQKEGYQEQIEITRNNIVVNCNMSRCKSNYDRVIESLDRWNSVSIKFNGTFYDGKKYLAMGFHIIDQYHIEEESRHLVVKFNSIWLKKIRESEYFKYINFGYYKALKRPLSRRLHEILCKTFLDRSEWKIKVVKLGVKLGMSGTTRNGKTVYYASNILQKLIPAINEINNLAKDPDIAEKTGIRPEDLFTISYRIYGEKNDKVIVFTKHPVVIHQIETPADDEQLPELLSLLKLKRRSKKLEDAIGQALQEHGYEYVKWNILYANKQAKTSYSTYLQKALAENWGEEWWQQEQENERVRRETEKRIAAAVPPEQVQQEKAEMQNEEFLLAVAEISGEDREKLWDTANLLTPDGARPFEYKLRFVQLLLDYLKKGGKEFSVSNMEVARKVEF